MDITGGLSGCMRQRIGACALSIGQDTFPIIEATEGLQAMNPAAAPGVPLQSLLQASDVPVLMSALASFSDGRSLHVSWKNGEPVRLLLFRDGPQRAFCFFFPDWENQSLRMVERVMQVTFSRMTWKAGRTTMELLGSDIPKHFTLDDGQRRMISTRDAWFMVDAKSRPEVDRQTLRLVKDDVPMDLAGLVGGRWVHLYSTHATHMEDGKVSFSIMVVDETESRKKQEELERLHQIIRILGVHTDRRLYIVDFQNDVLYRTGDGMADPEDWRMVASLNDPYIQSILLPESLETARAFWQDMKHRPYAACKVHMHSRLHPGQTKWMELKATALGGGQLSLLSVADVTRDYQLQLDSTRYRSQLDTNLHEDGFTFDIDLAAEKVENFTGVLGMLGKKEAMPLEDFRDWILGHAVIPAQHQEVGDALDPRTLRELYDSGRKTLKGTVGVRGSTGKVHWYEATLMVARDRFSGSLRAFMVCRNVTKRHVSVEILQRLAERDSLTGLYNRGALVHLAEAWMSTHSGSPCQFVLFDLDNLKDVNDTKGHEAGDRALVLLGHELERQFFKEHALASRYGGDEFVVFRMEDGPIEPLMERLYKNLKRCSVSVSAGIIKSKAQAGKFPALARKADALLYEVKRGGRGFWKIGEESS